MMCKSLLFILVSLLSSASCRAFQITPIRTALPSSSSGRRVLVPHGASNDIQCLLKSSALLATAIQQTTKDHGCDLDVESPTTIGCKNKIAFTKFFSIIKRRVISIGSRFVGQPTVASFFLSLSIFLLPFFVLSGFPGSASAVQSGGRMGGSFGGGSSRRQSSSRSYNSPSRSSRSYSSRPGRSSSSSPSRSSSQLNSAPSRSIGDGYSRGYSRGYSSGYPRMGYPRMGYRRQLYSPSSPYCANPSGVAVVARPNPLGRIFFIAAFLYVANFVLSNIGSIGSYVNDSFSRPTIRSSEETALGSGVSVAEISVALDVPDRDSPNSILSALTRLSRTASTDSRVGIQDLTSQVAIELLRRKLSIVAASTHASHYRDGSKAQREYNQISIQQRSKFERETLSKYGGVDYNYSDGGIESTQQFLDEYSPKATIAVVTIVLMIDGDSTSKKLSSTVNSIRDVEGALSCIAADAKVDNCLRGSEILWSPEERDETLTMKDVLADYCTLRSI